MHLSSFFCTASQLDLYLRHILLLQMNHVLIHTGLKQAGFAPQYDHMGGINNNIRFYTSVHALLYRPDMSRIPFI